MEELLALLKQARQEKNISLEEISAQTKIQIRYLEALENSDFSPFTGEVYVKGALCNYAEIVGLEPKEILTLYHRLKDDTGAAQGEEQLQLQEERHPEQPRAVKPVKKMRARKREGQGPSLTTGIVLLVLALIGSGIWFSQNYNPPALRPEPEQTENNTPGGNGTADGDEPEPENQPRQQVTTESELSGETVFNVSGFSEIEMTLAFQAPCWVQLSVDGTEPFYPRTFQEGENYTVAAAETVRLRMGNPRAVRITVNGFEVTENRELSNPHNFRFNLE